MLESFFDEYMDKFNFDKGDALMIGDASGKTGQFSDSDKKTAENFGIDYLDVEDFVSVMNATHASVKINKNTNESENSQEDICLSPETEMELVSSRESKSGNL